MMKSNTRAKWMVGIFTVILVTLVPGISQGASYVYWSATSGDWSDGSNWQGGSKPQTVDYAVFRNDGTSTVTTAEVVDRIYMGWSGYSSGHIILDSGSLTVSSFLYIGHAAAACSFVQNGGALTNSSNTRIGETTPGTYTLNNGTMSLKTTYIPYGNTTGTFNQVNGTNIVNGKLILGNSASGVGTYNMSGGTLKLTVGWSHLIVGNVAGSTGTFVQTGGSVMLTNAVNLEVGANGSKGTYKLGGSGTLKIENYSEYIYSGGTFIQTGGMNQIGGNLGVKTNGVFRGWGNVTVNGQFQPNGIIIADSYGDVDRTLMITNFSRIYHNATNDVDGTNGYYAVHQGKLTLPALDTTISNPLYWGDYKWPSVPDLVNLVKIHKDSTSDDGLLLGSLYATNNTAVPAYDKTSKIIGIWGFDDSGDSVAMQADLTFKYDQVAASNLGIAEGDLKVYTHAGGESDEWTQITDFGLDTTANTITASNVTDVTAFFAVGDGIVNPLPPKGTTVIIQ